MALHSREHHLDDCYWWCDSYLQFEVAGFKGHLFSGVCRLPLSLDAEPASADEAAPEQRQETPS